MSTKTKILLVDENGFERSALRRFISEHVESQVLEAENARDVFGAFLNAAPDLIVFDLPYEMGNGLSLIRFLRAADCITPIMVISTRHNDLLEEVVREAGADCLLLNEELPHKFAAAAGELLERKPCCEEHHHENAC
ncbi:MAG TPA: response regulator [Kiritimatiellia bacterium]|jgi:DNA-binding NarL/FixJ family response regulator